MYVVKNGTDSDNLSSDATPTSGHGIYIDGGLGITIQASVTEYNTGAGLYLGRAEGYALKGLDIKGLYFEQNKYAQMLVDYTSGNWQNVDITGSSFNSPFTYPSNSLTPTNGDIAVLDRIPIKEDVKIEGRYGLLRDKAIVGFERVSLKPNELFDRNFFPYTKSRVRKDLPECEGHNCLVVNQSLGNFLEYGENNFVKINPYLDYLVELEYKMLKDGATPSFSLRRLNKDFVNMDTTDGGSDLTSSTFTESTSGFIKKTIVFTKDKLKKDTRFLQLYLALTNPTANSYWVIRSFTVTPIATSIVTSAPTTSRPPLVPGITLTIFDTTLNKPIWGYAGIGWVDATGTVV